MIKLLESDYYKVKPLIKSENEISVFGAIDGDMPGEFFVNNLENPTAALIKTCECNLVAGITDDNFISKLSSELDFWDEVTPDSQDWFEKIPLLHKNKFIRPFKRRRYVLNEDSFIKREMPLPDGFVLEKINLDVLRNSTYKNSESILEWVEGWGGDTAFIEKGAGNYIRNNESIVSWSISDCSYADQITIGVQTDEKYRKQGFGIRVVSETVNDCFMKGYKTINWLCVDSNRGSIILGEKIGFVHNNDYFFFCSYLPTENPSDISVEEWFAWAKHLEDTQEPQLIEESVYSYMKANDVVKVIEMIKSLPQFGIEPDFDEYTNTIHYFQLFGLSSNFNEPAWLEFIDLHKRIK